MLRRNLHAMAMIGAVSLLCWQSTKGGHRDDDMMELYGTFVDAVEQVESHYVRPVSRKELLENALQGMLQELDPYSEYIDDAKYKQFKNTFEGSFTGIGIRLDVDAEAKRLKVLAPLIGSPAYEAGVLANDVILEIDGKSTEGATLDDAVGLLQGRPGTTVKLTVLHQRSDKAETYEITRRVIATPSVLGWSRKADDSWDYFLDPEAKIGYVRITLFEQNTADELKEALDALKAEGMKGLVLDLRDNPGGLLAAGVQVSDLFVEGGRIVSTRGRNAREQVYDAQAEGTFEDFPMVVMVNQQSASAAEIVSACLQDSGRAKVVGQRSYGKGSVQNILPLEHQGSVLKLTVATYWRPSGKNIHKFPDAKDGDEWGVSPDDGLEVKLGDREYIAWALARREQDLNSRLSRPKPDPAAEPKADAPKPEPAEKDRQLDKALEAVRGLVADA